MLFADNGVARSMANDDEYPNSIFTLLVNKASSLGHCAGSKILRTGIFHSNFNVRDVEPSIFSNKGHAASSAISSRSQSQMLSFVSLWSTLSYHPVHHLRTVSRNETGGLSSCGSKSGRYDKASSFDGCDDKDKSVLSNDLVLVSSLAP